MDGRKAISITGLIGLLLLDAALVAWALWPTPLPSAAPTPSMPVTSETQGSEVEPTTSPTASPTGDWEPVPLARMVAATSASIAWLADVGACGDTGRIHVTVTGGEKWATAEAPGSVLRIRPTDGSTGFVVGGDADCEPHVWYTGDRGETWSPPQSAGNAWGRDPDEAQLVLRPGGAPVQPCGPGAVLDLVGLSGGAATALCGDGRVTVTTDRGETWANSVTAPGALALSFTEVGEGVVVARTDGCIGVTVSAVSAGELGAPTCVDEVAPVAGQVAISMAPRAVWLVVGSDVLRATGLTGPFSKVATWPGA